MSRYRFIAAERGHYPVRRLCQVLGVPASGFYAWQAGQQQAFLRLFRQYAAQQNLSLLKHVVPPGQLGGR